MTDPHFRRRSARPARSDCRDRSFLSFVSCEGTTRSSTWNERQTLTCRDCGQTFVFTAGEQAFYQERGFSEPQRCPACRSKRKAERGAEAAGTTTEEDTAAVPRTAAAEAEAATRPVPARCTPRPVRTAARRPGPLHATLGQAGLLPRVFRGTSQRGASGVQQLLDRHRF